ncbi:nuclear transport factor 2 family protein [Amycolatopsis taiwanensis]|uniref:nuclear transport factor 2 family protein n=1 Tax=Amycolatopsis taiwanensis TaxID=342230 RepID=UPI0004B3516A|nr:nuclear transport factor 2 family protein [Amycolatopsis taiwanensis]
MTPNVEQTIRDLEDMRYTAVLNGNFEAFRDLSHPALIYTHSSGAADSLESYLDKCRSGFYTYHSINHPIDFITVVDDVALVVGEMHAELTINRKPVTLHNRSLAVWKNTDRSWRFLAFQPTPIPAS